MPDAPLKIVNDVRVPDSTMLLALSGWMDGGSVSTGTVKHLMRNRRLIEIATLAGRGFYIDSFPGGMEIASLLRPHVRYDDGVVESFEMHSNEIMTDVDNKLVFFVGREPNLNWESFGDCVFEVARKTGVTRIVFMGSFGGAVPHTREPRMYGSVSDKSLRPMLKHFGLRPTDYEGPASFSTYLLTQAGKHGIDMLSIAAEIPGYLEGANPLSIEAVARRIGNVLNLPVDLAELRKASTEWEAQVSEAVAKDKGLAKTIRRLENEYDNDLVETLSSEED